MSVQYSDRNKVCPKHFMGARMKMRFSISKFMLPGLVVVMMAFLVASCGDFKKTAVVAPPSTEGKVDFTSYVALGNSLVAGYQSGALYESSQEYSYPNIIAQQAGIAMGTKVVFNQPLISDPGFGVSGTTPVGQLEVTNLATNPPTIAPATAASPTPINATTVLQPYNNLGVPGAILSDMMDTTSFSKTNPYFNIVLRNPVFGKSCVQQALALHPTFITIEVGDNDILGYATAGGLVPYTPVQAFQAEFDTLMNTLLTGAPNAKFAIANIPDVTVIPFFTTIKPFIYGPNGQPIVNSNGSHLPMFVAQHGQTTGTPADTLNDLILLTGISALESGAGTSPSNPMPDQYVLDASEVATAKSITDQYNQTIAAVAALNPTRVALVNIHDFLNNVARYGYVSDGISFTSAFVAGGLFGLDGIHPTCRGYGILANEFITTINKTFGSNIPVVAISTIPSSIAIAGLSSRTTVLPRISHDGLRSVLWLFDHHGSY